MPDTKLMPKQLRLHTLPDDEQILRAANQEISFPLSKKIVNLIADMKLTVQKAPGIGLAAPQVGHNVMLCVINLGEPEGEPFALINPKVISKSIKKTGMEEGCLSIPGKYGEVRRPAKIEVEAWSENGKRLVIKADQLFAKVLQHEIDHLNGTLIADKI